MSLEPCGLLLIDPWQETMSSYWLETAQSRPAPDGSEPQDYSLYRSPGYMTQELFVEWQIDSKLAFRIGLFMLQKLPEAVVREAHQLL